MTMTGENQRPPAIRNVGMKFAPFFGFVTHPDKVHER